MNTSRPTTSASEPADAARKRPREHDTEAVGRQVRARTAIDPSTLPPVRMKPLNTRHGGPAIGVSEMDLRVAARVEQRHGQNGMPIKSAAAQPILGEERADGTWRIGGSGADAGKPLHGHFTFVKMMNGELRLGNAVNGQKVHMTLSGNASQVRYAGEVEFAEGKPAWFGPQSSVYQSSDVLRLAAGFAQGTEFRPVAPDGLLPNDARASDKPSPENRQAAIAAAEQAAGWMRAKAV